MPTRRRGANLATHVEKRQPCQSRLKRGIHDGQAKEAVAFEGKSAAPPETGGAQKAIFAATLCGPAPTGSQGGMSAMDTGRSMS